MELSIKNKKFNLPEKWEDITLKQFIDMAVIQKDEHYSDIDAFIQYLSALANDKELANLLCEVPIDEFNLVQKEFKWLLTVPPVNKTKTKNEFLFTNESGEIETWAIKNDFSKLTTGEAISLEILLKDKRINLLPMEVAFGILFRRKTKEGELEPFDAERLQEIIDIHAKNIKLVDIYDTLTFFLGGEKSSITRPMQISFKRSQVQESNPKTTNSGSKNKKQPRRADSTGGRGTTSLTH